jgi:hypothetical protein
MIDALTQILLGYGGISRSASWAGEEADGVDDPDDVPVIGSDTPPELKDGEIAIFDPDSRTYTGKMRGLVAKRHKRRSANTPTGTASKQPAPAGKSQIAKPQPFNPAQASKSRLQKSPLSKRKHRVI